MQYLSGLFFLFMFIACTSRREDKQAADKFNSPDTLYHEINAFGGIRGDTSRFVPLKCGLYINREGVIGYRTTVSTRPTGTTADSIPLYIYLTTVFDADPSDSINGGQKEMRLVVDTSTLEMLGHFYFKDKNHVYDFNQTHDGGTIGINTVIDKNSFQILESEFYGKDNKHCFYWGRLIAGADVKTFRVLDTSYSHYIAWDKNNFYYGENRMTKKEIMEQRLDSIRRKKSGL